MDVGTCISKCTTKSYRAVEASNRIPNKLVESVSVIVLKVIKEVLIFQKQIRNILNLIGYLQKYCKIAKIICL